MSSSAKTTGAQFALAAVILLGVGAWFTRDWLRQRDADERQAREQEHRRELRSNQLKFLQAQITRLRDAIVVTNLEVEALNRASAETRTIARSLDAAAASFNEAVPGANVVTGRAAEATHYDAQIREKEDELRRLKNRLDESERKLQELMTSTP